MAASSSTQSPSPPRPFRLPALSVSVPHVPGKGLVRLVRLLIILRSYAKEILKGLWRYPLSDVLFGVRYGFAADRVHLYGRPGIKSGEYLSDLQRQFTRFINAKAARELLEDKLLFAHLVGKLARVPENYLYFDRQRQVIVSDRWHELAACRDPNRKYRLVMKPARGGGGVEISFPTLCSGVVTLAESSMTVDEFLQCASQRNEYIVSEFIEQSAFFKKLHPGTTNTLRVICMWDESGQPFIARAVLRLGSARSGAVDSFGQGGLVAPFDVATGVLAEAVDHDASSPRQPRFYAHHPDTGEAIAGEKVPGWAVARDESLRLMREMPFINYVGWDIVMSNDGPVFLEGNNYTGVRLAQSQEGLLRDVRVRQFYERFGII